MYSRVRIIDPFLSVCILWIRRKGIEIEIIFQLKKKQGWGSLERKAYI